MIRDRKIENKTHEKLIVQIIPFGLTNNSMQSMI